VVATASVRRLELVVLAGIIAATVLGCGGTSGHSAPVASKLEREDLVAVSRALKSIEAPVAGEVGATKAAWPLIANGLPADTRTVSGAPAAAKAAQAAAQLKVPALLSEARTGILTGPAAQLGGLVRSYMLLSSRGWKLLNSSIEEIQAGPPARARFARENSPLYIESIYDGHFTLAQIGKQLTAAYTKLGGPAAFGASLSQAEIEALAQTYSEENDRLHPHVGARLGS
jgi:hypothetical protein